VKCPRCHGTGVRYNPEAKVVVGCWNCGGSGKTWPDWAPAAVWFAASLIAAAGVFTFLYFGV
jgi:hypothetical protein